MEANPPLREVDGKLPWPHVVICAVGSRVHGRLLTRVEKEIVVLKNATDTLDLSMMKKTAADSKFEGKNTGTHATYLVNSCQGKIVDPPPPLNT